MQNIGNPKITKLCLHHSAVSRYRQSIQLEPVNRYHRDKWGMLSALGWYGGYNFFCDVDGTVTQFRAIGEETIAQVGHNCDIPSRCDTVSFCFAGDFNTELPNDKQIAAFHKWHAGFKSEYSAHLVGHRDLQKGRTCPGALMSPEYISRRLQRFGLEEEEHSQLSHSHRTDLLKAALRRIVSLLRQKLSTRS